MACSLNMLLCCTKGSQAIAIISPVLFKLKDCRRSFSIWAYNLLKSGNIMYMVQEGFVNIEVSSIADIYHRYFSTIDSVIMAVFERKYR